MRRPACMLCSLVVLTKGLNGCGGGDDPAAAHEPLQGSFAQVFGRHPHSFSLAADKINVHCTPRPGLNEFEYEAATTPGSTTGTYFHLLLKDYTGPASYELEYDVAKPQHLVEVGFPAEAGSSDGKGYHYRFFQYLRSDVNETYRSHCDLTLGSEEREDKTRFTAAMSCTLLFADFDSKDSSVGMLNSFVDLVARFECER